MTTITYKSRTERFYDDFERELRATGLREAILELTRRLEALESQQGSTPIRPVRQNPDLSMSDEARPVKKKRGRKPGFKQPWSEARHEAHRLKKARRLEEIRNNPRLAALTEALTGMVGVKPAAQSESGNGDMRARSETWLKSNPTHSDLSEKP